ncbi:MAG: hypothetical protein GX220_02535 [Treponema sp.]|nr:hypothetical protein [Treponema sp.]
MKKIFIMQIVFTLFLVLAVCFSAIGISCKLTPEGITVLTGDYTSPKLIELSVNENQTLNLVFSKEVNLRNLSIIDGETKDIVFSEDKLQIITDDNLMIDVIFQGKTECGKSYNLLGIAEDKKGSSLSFELEFSGFNENVCSLLFSEVRTEYSKGKIEFVEFLVTNSGNLAGIEFLCANGKNVLEYVFPSCEVNKGEYIVLHCRLLEETCIDEIGEDLNECKATDSCDNARDFWINNQTACIGKTDVILLKERKGGKIVDALLFAEEDKDWKAETMMQEFADLAFAGGVWQGGSEVTHAFCSKGVTTTRTISRIRFDNVEEANCPENWIVTKTSGATPGNENCTQPYVN